MGYFQRDSTTLYRTTDMGSASESGYDNGESLRPVGRRGLRSRD